LHLAATARLRRAGPRTRLADGSPRTGRTPTCTEPNHRLTKSANGSLAARVTTIECSRHVGLDQEGPSHGRCNRLLAVSKRATDSNPQRSMMKRPSPPSPRAPSVGFQRKAERPITWREATSNSVRDECWPENRSAVKNGKEGASNLPTCIGVFHHRRYHRAGRARRHHGAIAERAEWPPPHCVEPKHRPVARRVEQQSTRGA